MKYIFNTLFKKTLYNFLLLMTFLVNYSHAQDYPIAPEIWSEPVRLNDLFSDSVCIGWPSLTTSFDTLYFLYINGDIFQSINLQGIWQVPTRLNSTVNDGTPVRSPTISKNGKRLYYSAYVGGWDLWYNDWIDSLNAWGPRYNMGPEINSNFGGSYFVFEASPDTLYTISSKWLSSGPARFVWNDSLARWSVLDTFVYHYDFGIGQFYGLSLPKNQKKIYYGLRPWDEVILEEIGMELCVNYWDSTLNNWGQSYYLNCNSIPSLDTINNREYRGTDSYPWVSENGKVLIFESDRDSLYPGRYCSDFYISYLLVDENGDTVTALPNQKEYIQRYINLQQNYPNPFNPGTVITYTVPVTSAKPQKVTVTVYDSGGREIDIIVDSFQNPGDHKVYFDGSRYGLANGIYFYQIKIGSLAEAKKMLYLK